MEKILTINRGDSLSIAFNFPAEYDMSRFEGAVITLGRKIYPYVIEGLGSNILAVQIAASTTEKFTTVQELSIKVTDSLFGEKTSVIGWIETTTTNVSAQDPTLNNGYNLYVPLAVTEATIAASSLMYNVLRGQTAYEAAVAGGYTGTPAEFDAALAAAAIAVPYTGATTDVDLNEHSILVDSVRFEPTPRDIARLPYELFVDEDNQTIAMRTPDGGDVDLAVKGEDDNFVTDAEKTKLSNLSGTNTGDQDLTALQHKAITPISGMTATTVEEGLGELNAEKLDKNSIVTVLTNQLFDKNNYQDNIVISITGTFIVIAGAKTTNLIPVLDTENFITFSGKTDYDTRYAFYDIDEVAIEIGTLSSIEGTIEKPSGTKYFALSFKASSDEFDYSDTLMINYGETAIPLEVYEKSIVSVDGANIKKDYFTGETQAKIDNLIVSGDLYLVTGNQLFDKINGVLNNFFLNSEGGLTVSANSKTTDFVDIKDGETQLSWSGAISGTRRYAFYDVDEVAIEINIINSASGTHSIPEGSKKYRQTYKDAIDEFDYSDTLMINYGLPKPYESYQLYIDKILGIPFVDAGSESAIGVSSVLWQYNNTDAEVTGTDLFKMFTLLPNKDVDGDRIGCTGACYNTKIEQYVIAYYSFAKASKLWFYNRKDLLDYTLTGTLTPTPTRELDLSEYLYHIQGVTYDQELDNYWVLGSLNAISANNERVLLRIDDDGNLIEKTVLSAYDFQAGMIDMSPDMKNLIIKPNDKNWVLEIEKFSKELVRQVTTTIYSEGLGVDYKNSVVWLGGNSTNNLNKYNYEDFELLESYIFQTLPNGETQNIEGIIIDPIDDAVIIVADAYLHGSNNNGNAMCVFDFNKTIGKQVRFPQMIKWQGDESYVIDFGASNSLTPATIEDGDGELMYRGSDTAPSLTLVNRVNWRDRPYYAGWGTTTPSEWSSVMLSYQYMQIKRM